MYILRAAGVLLGIYIFISSVSKDICVIYQKSATCDVKFQAEQCVMWLYPGNWFESCNRAAALQRLWL